MGFDIESLPAVGAVWVYSGNCLAIVYPSPNSFRTSAINSFLLKLSNGGGGGGTPWRSSSWARSAFCNLEYPLILCVLHSRLRLAADCCRKLPPAQQGFRVLSSRSLGILEVVEGSARALQMIRHSAIHPSVRARQFPVALLQQISDRWARAGLFGRQSWLVPSRASGSGLIRTSLAERRGIPI